MAGTTEKIKIMMVKRGDMKDKDLAERLEMSPQNLYNKFKADNYKEMDLHKIATALGYSYVGFFVDNTTGEKI